MPILSFYTGKYQLNFSYTPRFTTFHPFSVNVQIITLTLLDMLQYVYIRYEKITIQSK